MRGDAMANCGATWESAYHRDLYLELSLIEERGKRLKEARRFRFAPIIGMFGMKALGRPAGSK